MDGTRYILAGRFIDGSGDKVQRNILIKVQGGTIVALEPMTVLPGDAVVDDLSHCTVVPALVDCSVSLLLSPSVNKERPEEKDTDREAVLTRHSSYCFAHGVLGLVVHDKAQVLQKYRKERCHGYDMEVRTACDIAGADFIRLVYSNDIEEEAGCPLPLDNTNLCRILRNRGEKKAIVLANGARKVAEALAAGCDAIEQGYGMGEDNLKIMAERDVLWIPGVLRAKNALDGSVGGGSVCCRFSTRYVAPGEPVPGAELFWKKILSTQLALLRSARELGVKVAVGSGAGSAGILHGESVVEEIKLFIKAGYSLEESIGCASKNGAEFFGMQKLGQLATGQPATFLLTRGTLGQLPRKLSYLEGIYIDGRPSRDYKK